MSDATLRAAISEGFRAGAKYTMGGKTPATLKRRGRSRTRSAPGKRSRSVSVRRVAKRLRFGSASRSRSRSAVGVRTRGAIRGTAELSHSKSGSRRPRRVTFNQLAKVTLQKRILRWQLARPMNRPYVVGGQPYALPGAQALLNLVTRTGDGTDTYQVPVNMYCLNSTLNDTNAVGPTVAGNIRFLDDGKLSFSDLVTTDATGAAATPGKWEVEWVNHGSGILNPATRYINTSWYDIRMLLYGAKKQPTQYEIIVFKFKDGHLDPLSVPADSREAADRDAFYQHMSYDYVKNPILTGGMSKMFWQKIRVMYRKRVDIAPSMTDEDDPTANRHMIKIFLNDGKTYDYCSYAEKLSSNDELGGYSNIVGANNVTINNNPFFTAYKQQQFNTADYGDYPKARGRIWLMVRCLNTSLQAASFTNVNGVAAAAEFTPTPDNTPSFDLMIRKKESYSLA